LVTVMRMKGTGAVQAGQLGGGGLEPRDTMGEE
jgi:hypothetical protein